MRAGRIQIFVAVAATWTLLPLTESVAAIANGGFETGTFSSWSTDGNTSIETVAYMSGPTEGTFQALMTTTAGKPDSDLETLLGVPAGTLDTLSLPPNETNAIEGAAISQSITANAGDILTFDWNFLTNADTPDMPFNDFAFWSLASLHNGMMLTDLNDSGFAASPTVFNEETGFRSVNYVFPSSGTFTLGFGVMDVGNDVNNSALLVDNVQLTLVPEPSSLALLGVGLVGGLLAKRSRRKRTLATS